MKSLRNWSLFAVLTCILFLSAAMPGDIFAKETYEEKFSQTLSLAKDGKVILSNISGDIEVRTWNKGEVKIEALKTSKTTSAEQAKKNFEKVEIKITEEGKTLRIETKYAKDYFKRSSRSVSVRYWLTIPAQAHSNITSISGDVALEEIGGNVTAKSISGDLDLNNIAGSLTGKSTSGDVIVIKADKGADCSSVSGDVEAKNVTGNADLSSVSGDIVLENCRGGDVEADTVSGSIDLINVTDARKVTAKALSGSVKYSGKIFQDGIYHLKSHSGDIVMLIPANSGFDFRAKTFSGGIKSDFEISVSGKVSKRELKGTVNGGGAELEAATFSGDVNLKKK